MNDIKIGTRLVFIKDGFIRKFPYAVAGTRCFVRKIKYHDDGSIEGVIIDLDAEDDNAAWDLEYFIICPYINTTLNIGGNI